jgi:hypothetical protein
MLKKADNLLTERKTQLGKKLDARTTKYQGIFVNKLIESVNSGANVVDENVKIYDKTVKINNDIDSMIKDINKMLDE